VFVSDETEQEKMMHYFAILLLNGHLASVGPFQGVMACETAVNQTRLLAKEAKGICVPVRNLGTHWNGKAVPK